MRPAFVIKQAASPITAIMYPPIGGPITLAVLKRREFKAIAFPRSCGSTISPRKVCLPVISKAFIIPSAVARMKI